MNFHIEHMSLSSVVVDDLTSCLEECESTTPDEIYSEIVRKMILLGYADNQYQTWPDFSVVQDEQPDTERGEK